MLSANYYVNIDQSKINSDEYAVNKNNNYNQSFRAIYRALISLSQDRNIKNIPNLQLKGTLSNGDTQGSKPGYMFQL